MPTKTKPRSSNYMGMRSDPHTMPDGTWLEPEELCYPHGGMTRKAYAKCEDGIIRVVVCGIPDTYFSIPARARIGGRSVRGFVSGGNDGYTFTAYAKQ